MLRRVAAISLLLLLSSCFSKATKSVVESSPKSRQAEILPTNGVMVVESHYADELDASESKSIRSWSSIIETVEGESELKSITLDPNDGEILISTKEFSSLETQHVSNKEHNPFGDKSYFILPLSEMKSDFCYPIKGKFLSNYGMRHGRMHSGVDIKAAPRDTIRAAFDGVVRLSKPYSGYGNVIVIRHFNGIETVYSHNSVNLVKVNQMVRSGDPISLAGRTGRATTEHLHFEVRVRGQHLNPNMFIDVHNHTLKDDDLYISNRGGKISVSTTIPRSADEFTLAHEESIDPEAVKVVEAAAIKTPASTHKQESVADNYNGKVHAVRRGDTLSAIAKRYGTTVNKLYKANGLTSRSVLQIGQKIKIK